MGVGKPGQASAYAPNISPFFGLLPPELWDRTKLFFVYGIDFAALAAAVTTPGQIAIQADSDFFLTQIVAKVRTEADATVALPWLINLQLLDSGSGRQLFNQPQCIENVAGGGSAGTPTGGGLPFYPTLGYLFRANSTITTSLTNLTAATTFNVQLSFIGIKIFLGY